MDVALPTIEVDAGGDPPWLADELGIDDEDGVSWLAEELGIE